LKRADRVGLGSLPRVVLALRLSTGICSDSGLIVGVGVGAEPDGEGTIGISNLLG
jgi:hypothetical protein